MSLEPAPPHVAGRSRAPRVAWTEALPQRPLCDVPWLGRSNVLSDGSVNFCCFSDAVVGNVREQRFAEIWNGPAMQRIRAALARQAFPEECRSPSCPIFRGDESSSLRRRIDGPYHARWCGNEDPHAALRERVHRSDVVIHPSVVRRGERLDVRFDLVVEGEPFDFDLYVGVRSSSGVFRFLPEGTEYPLPFVQAGGLGSAPLQRSLVLLSDVVDVPAGRHELTVALFVPGSDPMLASNCVHSIVRDVEVS